MRNIAKRYSSAGTAAAAAGAAAGAAFTNASVTVDLLTLFTFIIFVIYDNHTRKLKTITIISKANQTKSHTQ